MSGMWEKGNNNYQILWLQLLLFENFSLSIVGSQY